MSFGFHVEIIEGGYYWNMVFNILIFIDVVDRTIFTTQQINNDLITFFPSIWTIQDNNTTNF